MATYKKGYKKTKPELAILKTVGGILAGVLVLILAAFIYDKATDWNDYTSYEHLTTYDEVLSQEEDDYVVYFYSTASSTSASIKSDVLKVLNDYDNVYLVNTANISEAAVAEGETAYTEDTLLAALSIESVTAPMVVVVADGSYEETLLGTVNIQEFLDQLDAGTYAPFTAE